MCIFKKNTQISDTTMETHKSMEIDIRKLVVKKVIGRGASAHVHIGVYNGRRVAVKLFDEERGKSNATGLLILKMVFEDEIYLWHTLDHPNVSRFVGAVMGTTNINFEANRGNEAVTYKPSKPYCIISDYQSGGTLKSYLMSLHEKKLPLKKVIHFSLGLARGLSYLHAKNIMHRDIKTDNVLLDKNRVVKITDFGVSTFDTSNSESITDRVGTYGYMAPEPYDKKCDAYSFGVCLWEIYCCEKPFECFGFDADTAADIYKNSSLELPKNCPKYLVDLMERCMDKDPKKRPGMEKVVEILEGIQLRCTNETKPRFHFKCWS